MTMTEAEIDRFARQRLRAEQLDNATFWQTSTNRGPIIQIYPSGLLPRAEDIGELYEQPEPLTLLAVADLAVNLAVQLDGEQLYGSREFLLLVQSVWPVIDKQMMRLVQGPAGENFRIHIRREAAVLGDELAYGAREAARARGLKEAKTLIKTLVDALSEPSMQERATILASCARDIARALEG